MHAHPHARIDGGFKIIERGEAELGPDRFDLSAEAGVDPAVAEIDLHAGGERIGFRIAHDRGIGGRRCRAGRSASGLGIGRGNGSRSVPPWTKLPLCRRSRRVARRPQDGFPARGEESSCRPVPGDLPGRSLAVRRRISRPACRRFAPGTALFRAARIYWEEFQLGSDYLPIERRKNRQLVLPQIRLAQLLGRGIDGRCPASRHGWRPAHPSITNTPGMPLLQRNVRSCGLIQPGAFLSPGRDQPRLLPTQLHICAPRAAGFDLHDRRMPVLSRKASGAVVRAADVASDASRSPGVCNSPPKKARHRTDDGPTSPFLRTFTRHPRAGSSRRRPANARSASRWAHRAASRPRTADRSNLHPGETPCHRPDKFCASLITSRICE